MDLFLENSAFVIIVCFCSNLLRFFTKTRSLVTLLSQTKSESMESIFNRLQTIFAVTGAVSRYNVDRSQKTVKVYWSFIVSRCACPGARTIRSLSWEQELSNTKTSLPRPVFLRLQELFSKPCK